jgi:hypothetical protein
MTNPRGPRLEWALKPSFVAYVEGLPDGVVEVERGAARGADGSFVFPAVAGDTWAFEGAVRFHGHAGVLDVTIADPRIQATGTSWDLTIALGAARIRFATIGGLTATAPGVMSSTDVAATDDGAYVLGAVYPAGTPLHPFTIHTDVAR